MGFRDNRESKKASVTSQTVAKLQQKCLPVQQLTCDVYKIWGTESNFYLSQHVVKEIKITLLLCKKHFSKHKVNSESKGTAAPNILNYQKSLSIYSIYCKRAAVTHGRLFYISAWSKPYKLYPFKTVSLLNTFFWAQLFFTNTHAHRIQCQQLEKSTVQMKRKYERKRNKITVKTLTDGSEVFNLLSIFVLLFKEHISEFKYSNNIGRINMQVQSRNFAVSWCSEEEKCNFFLLSSEQDPARHLAH